MNLQQPSVVVADDDEVARMLFRRILEKSNYHVIDVENGRLACEAVASQSPDVVLLDWAMPVMDGLTALRFMKADAKTRTIPMLMVTKESQMEQRVLALEAGAQDFVTKPFDARELVARTDQHRLWRGLVAEDLSAGYAQVTAVADARDAALREAAANIERITHSATHDSLTGLANRALLEERIAQSIVSAQAADGIFAVLFLDIDDLKGVNDEWGHGAGDAVLKIIANRIKDVVRLGDTVARVGGDEFIVLAPKLAHPRNAAALAERLVHALRVPMPVYDRSHTVSVSIGVSLYPHDGTTLESLNHLADAAMYLSKQAGKDRYTFATGELLATARAAKATRRTRPKRT